MIDKIVNLLLSSLLLVFAGCACTSISKQTANGDKWMVKSNRLLWQTEHVAVKAPDGTIVEVSKTQPDAGAITATAGGIGTIIAMGIEAGRTMK